MTVTPETLTDEMIREEWKLAVGLSRPIAMRRILDCDSALYGSEYPGEADAARQRICDAINARSGGGEQ